MKKLLLFLTGIFSIVSFAQDGSLDSSFGDGGVVVTDFANSQEFGFSIKQQNDEKLLVAGTIDPNSDRTFPLLLRYMPDGSLDTSFGIDGNVMEDYGSGYNIYNFLFLENNGKIVAAGRTGINFTIAKYLTSGILDTTFGANGILLIPDEIYLKMELLNDGSFFLFKTIGENEIVITHYLLNGTLDINFGVNGSATSIYQGGSFIFSELKTDSENNLFVLGTRNHTDTADVILMKFLPTGYLDSNFGSNGVATKTINSPIPDSYPLAGFDFTNDEKVVIAGSYGGCLVNGLPFFQPFFMRFLYNGTPDTSFGNNGTVLLPTSISNISQLLVQENQRMIAIGDIPNCDEGFTYVLSRYFPGGTRDNSFIGTSANFDNNNTILQEDGKIVTVGNTFGWNTGGEKIVLIRHENNALSLPEFEKNKTTIYPNPSNGIFTIEREFLAEKEAFQITDITGKIIANGELNDKPIQINLSSAQSGIYFLKTSNSVFRLVKN